MPSLRTSISEGDFYHIYNKAVAGNLLFDEHKNYWYYLSKIKQYLLTTAEILTYCLMPDHYHLIVKIRSREFSQSMQKLALSYAVSYNNLYQRKGHLFLGPYQRKIIRDTPYLLHLSRYIHLNPVKANLVSKAENWKYSSYNEYIGFKPPDFVNPNTILDLLNENGQSSQTEKHFDYQKFTEEWDFKYMSFKFGE
jgi:putative transposase